MKFFQGAYVIKLSMSFLQKSPGLKGNIKVAPDGLISSTKSN